MKKNSFKRFLAITLAAATALTFAPVSTLGLSGVIEAQAATKDLSPDDGSGTTFNNGDVDVLTGTAKTSTPVYGYFDVTGSSSNDVQIAVSDLPSGVSIQTKDSTEWTDVNDASSITISKNTPATTVNYRFVVKTAASGTATVKTVDDTTTTTAKVVFNVSGPATGVSFTNSNKKALTDADTTVYVDRAGSGFLDANGDAVQTIGVTATPVGGDVADLTADSLDEDVATANMTNGVITVTPVQAGEATVNVYADSDAKTAKKVLGSFKVYVKTVKTDSLKAADLVRGGDAKDFTYTLDASDGASKLVILDSNGKIVSNEFIYTNPTFETVGKISVKTSAADNDTYTAEILTSTGTILAKDTFDVQSAASNTVSTSGTFTYGGVLNKIYAYKGASYDLAEHAALKYQNVNYSGSELEWYLVDASTDPKVGVTRSDLKSINMPVDAGTVESGKAGSLKVTVSDPDKFNKTINGGEGTKIVAEAVVNGVRTVVYVAGSKFTAPEVTENAVSKVIEVSANVQASGKKSDDAKKDVLDVKIANPTKDNIYLKASEVDYPVGSYTFAETDAHYTLHVNKASGDDNPFKGSYLELKNGDNLPTGTYYETEYIPFKVGSDTNTLYLLKVNTTVSVNTGVNFRVKDGESILATTFANDKLVTDPTVYLNLTDAKTWNIMDHIQADVKDIKDVTFTFDSDSANADVDKNGVVTAKSVGNAKITIKASYKGLESKTTLMVRVNQYGFDTVSVKGEDGTNAKVLSPRDYNNNSVSVVKVERNLVTRQIPYVQIFVTGNETSNVNYTPVVASANGAKLSYEFVEDYASKGLTIDPTTGKITIDYTKCTNNNYTALGVYGVKVVSADTNKSVATTSYYYVVVDFPDKTISGLEDNYTVGTCTSHLHNDDPAVALYTESDGTATSFDWVYKNTEDFVGDSHYKDDDISAFTTDTFATTGKICKAIVTDKTMHVLAYNAQSITNRTGYTAKLITVKSAPAVENYVDKIVNKETGEVLYDHSVNAGDTARELKIDKATTIQVSLKYPVASVASGSAVHLNIAMNNQTSGKIVNQTLYVTAVENSKEVDVALYPNSKGTTVITVSPAGHLTATDRTDIHKSPVNVAVTYTGEAANGAKNPAQVKGVKVSNKKGAKVTVKFNKITANSTMRYYVQKKVGKKVSGKSIGSTKTTLSVKKGATVKVRVKAYYYDANGVKHVGKYSAWKTLKTDKK